MDRALQKLNDHHDDDAASSTDLITQPPREGRPSSYAHTTRAPVTLDMQPTVNGSAHAESPSDFLITATGDSEGGTVTRTLTSLLSDDL